MRWLIPRVLVLWFALSAICAVGIAVGRLKHSPDALQVLGFDVCDGEPCFRGIKPGMDWKTVVQEHPEARLDGNCCWLIFLTDKYEQISINRLRSDTIVDGISYNAGDRNISPNLGQVIAFYGIPCRVELTNNYGSTSNTPDAMTLYYRTLRVQVGTDLEHYFEPTAYRLQQNLAVDFLVISDPADICDTGEPFFGPWQGFASFAAYEARLGPAPESEQR